MRPRYLHGRTPPGSDVHLGPSPGAASPWRRRRPGRAAGVVVRETADIGHDGRTADPGRDRKYRPTTAVPWPARYRPAPTDAPGSSSNRRCTEARCTPGCRAPPGPMTSCHLLAPGRWRRPLRQGSSSTRRQDRLHRCYGELGVVGELPRRVAHLGLRRSPSSSMSASGIERGATAPRRGRLGRPPTAQPSRQPTNVFESHVWHRDSIACASIGTQIRLVTQTDAQEVP